MGSRGVDFLGRGRFRYPFPILQSACHSRGRVLSSSSRAGGPPLHALSGAGGCTLRIKSYIHDGFGVVIQFLAMVPRALCWFVCVSREFVVGKYDTHACPFGGWFSSPGLPGRPLSYLGAPRARCVFVNHPRPPFLIARLGVWLVVRSHSRVGSKAYMRVTHLLRLTSYLFFSPSQTLQHISFLDHVKHHNIPLF